MKCCVTIKGKGYYQVRYEDNDEEEYNSEELADIVVLGNCTRTRADDELDATFEDSNGGSETNNLEETSPVHSIGTRV